MKIKALGVVLGLAAISGSGAARADATAPPTPPTGLVFAGNCYSPALNAKVTPGSKYEAGLLDGVLESVATTLISDAFDWLGAGIAKLGADQTTAVTSARTSEAPFNDHYCLQVVRLSNKGQTLTSIIAASGLPKGADQQTPAAALNTSPVNSSPIDFFVEFWVRPSKAGDAISLTPTMLYYPAYLNDHGSSKATQFVQVSLGGTGSDAASITWAMPAETKLGLQVLLDASGPVGGLVYRKMPSALSTDCEAKCAGASPWIANPWKDAQVADEKPADTPAPPAAAAAGAPAAAAAPVSPAKPVEKPAAKDAKKTKPAPAPGQPPVAVEPKLAQGVGPKQAAAPRPVTATPTANLGAPTAYGGTDFAAKAVNIQVTWTEVRDGSKFWKTVSDIFNAQKPTLETKVGQALFSDQAAKAKTDAMTASVAALNTFSTAMSDAESQRTGTYCAAKGVAGSNWTALSAALRAKQLAANVAAVGAGQPQPFNPIPVNSSYDPSICPVAPAAPAAAPAG